MQGFGGMGPMPGMNPMMMNPMLQQQMMQQQLRMQQLQFQNMQRMQQMMNPQGGAQGQGDMRMSRIMKRISALQRRF